MFGRTIQMKKSTVAVWTYTDLHITCLRFIRKRLTIKHMRLINAQTSTFYNCISAYSHVY